MVITMRRTLTTTALLGTLLMGGITACSQSNTPQSPQAETAPSNAAPANPAASNTSSDNTSSGNTSSGNTSSGNMAQSPDRAQRREAMRKQIEAILTPEQSQQLQAKLQQGSKMREAMASLNLTADQKAKIRDIMKSYRSQRSEQAPASSSQ